MGRSFTIFPQLPPEIRQHIWLTALTQTWECTTFKRGKRGDKLRVRIVGKINLSVRRACHEARSVMKLALTKQEATWSTTDYHGDLFRGWFNFDRHLFFFRDIDANFGLMKDIFSSGLLTQMHHIVINPRDYWFLMETIRAIKLHCTSVRTLVVVAPWLDRTVVDIPPDINPYEDWSPIFRESPTQLDLSQLLDDIDAKRPDNIYKHAWDQAKVQQTLEEFTNGSPLFFMRTRDDLGCPMSRSLSVSLGTFTVVPTTIQETEDHSTSIHEM
ncbi:hypothetical protein F4804DRAFT_327669 [Jackrogersella minutella]|nr:hypothetical protein F4804DRAFT_327669 [Jackrogersella minutella]